MCQSISTNIKYQTEGDGAAHYLTMRKLKSNSAEAYVWEIQLNRFLTKFDISVFLSKFGRMG